MFLLNSDKSEFSVTGVLVRGGTKAHRLKSQQMSCVLGKR